MHGESSKVSNEPFGTVYWITGLSGAGKTTIGRILYEKIRQKKNNVVFLDGDALREVFGNDLGYTVMDRRKSAMRNIKICRLISNQGVDVICSTISMFDIVREWGRENIKNYREIYLRVSPEVLKKRNQKGLYDTSISELVGFGVSMEEPKMSDLIIDNNGNLTPQEVCKEIWEFFEGES